MLPDFEPGAPRLQDPLELRASPRVAVDLPVSLDVSGCAGPLPGRARDVGIFGLCVATASPFALKSLQRVVLDLPGGRLAVPAEGSWQREVEADDVLLSGLAFLDPPEPVLDRLWELVFASGRELARFLYERTRLHELGVEEAFGLAQLSRYRRVPAGRALFRPESEGGDQDSVFVVVEGTMALQLRVRGARDVETERLEVGALFGGLPLLTGLPHPEVAVAVCDTRLLEIDRAAFRYLRLAKPWLGYRLGQLLLRVCAERTSRLCARVRDQL